MTSKIRQLFQNVNILRWAGYGAVGLLVLTGCGGSDDDGGSLGSRQGLSLKVLPLKAFAEVDVAVVIEGTGFDGKPLKQVRFGNREATIVGQDVTNRIVTVTVPPRDTNQAKTISVEATLNDGRVLTRESAFEYYDSRADCQGDDDVQISGIDPATPADSTTTIHGSHFQPGLTIQVGNFNDVTFVRESADTIRLDLNHSMTQNPPTSHAVRIVNPTGCWAEGRLNITDVFRGYLFEKNGLFSNHAYGSLTLDPGLINMNGNRVNGLLVGGVKEYTVGSTQIPVTGLELEMLSPRESVGNSIKWCISQDVNRTACHVYQPTTANPSTIRITVKPHNSAMNNMNPLEGVVALADFNGDGTKDVIIADQLHSHETAPSTVKSYVHILDGETGRRLIAITPDEAYSYGAEFFAISVGNGGDVNNDGYEDILVTDFKIVPNQPTGWYRVKVYSGLDITNAIVNSSNPTPMAVVMPPTTMSQPGAFGSILGTLGEVNGDGRDDFYVGAPFHVNNNNEQRGALWICSVTTTFSGCSVIEGDRTDYMFATSFKVVGDLNSDNFPDFLVTTTPRNAANGRATVGVLSFFDLVFLNQFTYLRGPVQEENFGDNFGQSISLAGDVDADGSPDFVVGAPHFTSNGIAQRGKTYLFRGSDMSLLNSFVGMVADDQLGYAVSSVGDVNPQPDGFDEFAMGMPGEDANAGGAVNRGKLVVRSK